MLCAFVAGEWNTVMYKVCHRKLLNSNAGICCMQQILSGALEESKHLCVYIFFIEKRWIIIETAFSKW